MMMTLVENTPRKPPATRYCTAVDLPLRPIPFVVCAPGLAPVDDAAREAAYRQSNLTLRQFLYWLEESRHPDVPLSQNVFLYALPEKLASYLEGAWQQFCLTADATCARLNVQNGIPQIDFGHPPEPLTVLSFDSPAPRSDELIAEHIFKAVDPWWTSFRPTESLVRHLLIRYADGTCFWLLTAGHLVCDGRAFDLMFTEMIHQMQALANGHVSPPPSWPSFEANMRRDREMEFAADNYHNRVDWRSVIGEDVPPFRSFGIDERTSPVCRVRASTWLTSEQVQALMHTAQRPELFNRSLDATLANFFTALTALWIWRHGGHSQVLFGIAFHGRVADEADLFGFKSEVLPLRLDLDATQSFAALVHQVHTRLRESLRYRGISIANPAHKPVLHATSNFLFLRSLQSAGREHLRRLELPRRSAAPQSVDFLQFNDFTNPGGMFLALAVHSEIGRFTDESRLSIGYLNALLSLMDNPLQRLSEVAFNDPNFDPFFEDVERVSSTQQGPEWLTNWSTQVGALGNRLAICHGEDRWTHAELQQEARRWTAHFKQIGLHPGDRVLVWSPSSNSLAAALLGLFSCNLTYVPIHHTTSAERVVETAKDLDARWILASHQGETTLEASDLNVLHLSRETVASTSPAVLTDPDPSVIAHIFHTSGTTGKPKAIAVTHASLDTFTTSWIAATHMQPGEVIFHFYAITFDPWLSALLPALILGGTCIVADQSKPLAGHDLLQTLDQLSVTSLCTPTAYFHSLCDITLPQTVKRWIVGGEALAADRAMRFVQRSPSAHLLNAYGPTETTVWASLLHVSAEHTAQVPIGRPLPSCGFRVVDETGMRTPFAVPGELWITGPQLAAGYVGQPDLTAAAFVHVDGHRWYRTGDLVRWRKDGALDYLGRNDRQLQIRGHRVEPVEIEAALRTLDGIEDARIVAVNEQAEQALCAYVIPSDLATPPPISTLKAALLRHLPEYKVPKWIIAVPSFEQSQNGKIDISRLPRPDTMPLHPTDDRLPTLTLWDLRLIFEKTLGLDRINVDDNFFELGGDSLRLIELLGEIEQHFGKRLDAQTVIDHPTIGALAPELERDRQRASRLVVELRKGTRPPLYCIPGAGGIGVEFYALSRRLSEDQCVIVLRSSGTDGHAHPPKNVDLLLEEHVTHVLRHRAASQTTGPVHLAGYSLGGVFAWEVAQRLSAIGVPVGCVILIDAHAGTAAGRSQFVLPKRSLLDRLLRRFDVDTRHKMRGYVTELDAALREGRIMDAARLGEYNRTAQALLSTQVNAKAGAFQTLYIKAATSDRTAHIEIWKLLAPNLRIEIVAGDHEGDLAITREPHVGRVAEIVQEVLQAAL